MTVLIDSSARSQWPEFDLLAQTQGESFWQAYKRARPFSHLVIDDLFPAPALRAMEQEFELASNTIWREYLGGLQRKQGTPPDTRLPPAVQDYFNLIYSGPFLRFLSRITGIYDLIPDPALYGGGMHQVAAGGNFELHVDFHKHPRTGLINRLAVITYLNDGWTAEDGGALELWEMNPPRRVTSVLPEFGRTVIMEQSSRSAHGHPTPVREGRQRRSAIAYFYTSGRAGHGSDSLRTTYVAHSGHTRSQRAELYLRQRLPRFIIKGLKTLGSAARGRRRGRS
jgi:hypothetical protein